MPRLLSLDVATTTGWCIYEDIIQGRLRIRCGSWYNFGDDFDTKAESLSDHLTDLLKAERASGSRLDYAAIEEPLRVIAQKRGRKAGDIFASTPESQAMSNANTMAVALALVGSACAILRQFHVPKRMVMPSTWRKSFIGITRAPATVARKDGSKWLKAQTRQAADALANKYGFHVPNNDASDAIGIAFWLAANVRHFEAEDEYLAKQKAA